MEVVLRLVLDYKYAAMFAVLVASGMGLPLPEEVTLIAAGLTVGWEEAHFIYAGMACVAGILVGDLIVWNLGRWLGPRLLGSRLFRLLLPERRRQRVERLFDRQQTKAIFFARFIAGLRIGVYFFAGHRRVPWWRFVLIDLGGALISGPTTIWLGSFAARRIADPHTAHAYASSLVARGQHWLFTGLGLILVLILVQALWTSRRDRLASRASALASGVDAGGAQGSADLGQRAAQPGGERVLQGEGGAGSAVDAQGQ